jgi:Fe-S-cluster-containing hydrogenase component 2/CRP-like cAMP-binding protein
MDARLKVAEQAEREVMACIGCNDCMLACPLPEVGIVSIADLNNAVQQPFITNPNVVRFVTACTQCRQCVPACPADLSRADMVLVNKMKVEDAVPDHVMNMQVGRAVAPSPWTLDVLSAQIATLQLFTGVPVTDVRRLVLKSTLRALAPREILCKEGEFHERLYVVVQGYVEQWSGSAPQGGAPGRPIRILALGQGSFFGEMAIMADEPEPYTVMAPVHSVVLEAPKAAVQRLINNSPPFKQTMDELYRRRALWTYARRPTGLGGFPEQAVQELLSAAELRIVKPGEFVFKENERLGDCYLVRSGFLRVSRKTDGTTDRVLIYFREGDFFGVLPLLMGERANYYTVQATSRSEVICIPAATMHAVISRYPDAHRALLHGALEMEQVARSPTFGPPPASAKNAATVQAFSMDVLVDQGLAKGREVLVIDQTRCTYCNNCIDACARRHKYSRLQLRGLQVENFLFPTACRHCEDPLCLLCSVNGIVRLPSGEITIVEDNCIGCGACAERCPYGNISMHAVNPEKKGFVFSLLDLVMGGARKEQATEELNPKVERRAVKCDLCAGFDDYACVTACPTGAAFRVDPSAALGGDAAAVAAMRRRGTLG